MSGSLGWGGRNVEPLRLRGTRRIVSVPEIDIVAVVTDSPTDVGDEQGKKMKPLLRFRERAARGGGGRLRGESKWRPPPNGSRRMVRKVPNL